MPRKDDDEGQERNEVENLWSMERRRLLQLTGASAASLGVMGASTGVASAKTGCARGPFEASYEAGVVNTGRIRAEGASGRDPGSMGAGSPGDTGGGESGARPPRQNAQESNAGEDGPLSIRTEYDGVNSLETRGGVPSDSQVAAGNGKLVHALNRNVAIYDKQSGNREQLFKLERLWEPVIPEPEGGFAFGVPFVFDPRARYDRNDDRYVLCATQFQFGLTDGGGIINREDLEERAQFGEGEDSASTQVSRPPKG